MENNLQIYANDAFGEIRGLMINGEPWFVGKDVAQALGYINTRKALIDHVDEEDKKSINLNTVTNRDGITGNPNVTIINESGLYSLIMHSTLPAAKEFQHWVTSEVLPSIRKTGAYEIPQKIEITKPSQIVKEVGETAETLQRYFDVSKGISLATATTMAEEFLKINFSVLKKLIPPAEHELDTLTPTSIGKQIGLSARKVNEKLTEMGLQYKDGDEYRLTDEGRKYAESMPYNRNGHSGYQIKWIPQIITILMENAVH